MTFEEYQRESKKTAQYPKDNQMHWWYLGLGIASEAGEVAGKIKKVIRDKGGVIDQESREAIKGEIGDVLWYISQLATELEESLDDIAQENIKKLFSRLERGKISGDGDNR